MKRIVYILLMCILFSETISAQAIKGFHQWFINNLHVANSMQTLDLSEQPAQFQMTFPAHHASSYLINVGIATVFNNNTRVNFISNLNVEYHRNTLTDAEQNNFSAGYGFKWLFTHAPTTDYFLTGDVQYVYDGVNIVNSVAGTFLITPFRAGKLMNWNTNNFRMNNRISFNLAPFIGIQPQWVFKSKQTENEGFILRPLFRVNGLVALNKKTGPPFQKIIALYCNYTGRTDLVNTTLFSEHYTQLLQTGVNYYIAYSPFEVSVGASFNNGSDPLHGLTNQQYWQISLNFMK